MHTFNRTGGDSDTTTYTLFREVEGRRLASTAAITLWDADGNHEDTLRMVCYLLDALAARDDEDLPPADWVEIGSDEEDVDMYADAYEFGYGDGVADALETVEDEADDTGPDGDEDELSDDDFWCGKA